MSPPDWLPIAAVACSVVSTWVAILALRRAGQRLAIEDARALESRLAAIEGVIRALPGHTEMGKLSLEEARLSGRIDTLAANLEAWKIVVNEQVAGVRSAIERTDHVLARLEDFALRGDLK